MTSASGAAAPIAMGWRQVVIVMRTHTRRGYVVAYSLAMTLFGVIGLVVGYLVSGSWLWALVGLLAAGPIGRALLGGLVVPPPAPGRSRGSETSAGHVEAGVRRALHR